MKERPVLALARRYEAALQKHLLQGAKLRVQPALRLGREATKLGLETLDLARVHKTALTALVLPGVSSAARIRKLKRAGVFFTEANTPIEKTHRAGLESTANLHQQNKVLTQRTAQLAAAKRELRQGVIQRKGAEDALRKSGKHYAELLRESRQLEKHLQHLTHQILSAQENERRKISHDLHDEIGQTLLGINVRLLTLRKGAVACRKDLAKGIASTQRLVEKSVKAINRFAYEFAN